MFWGALNGYYPYGTTGSISAGADDGMQRLQAVSALAVTIPDAPVTYQVGDNQLYGATRGRVLEAIQGNLDMTSRDSDFDAYVDASKVYTEGVMEEWIGGVRCQDFNQIAMLICSRARSNETATLNQKGWEVLELFNVEVQVKETSRSGANQEYLTLSYPFLANDVAYKLTGEAINSTNNGKSYGAYAVRTSPYPYYYHTHIGNNADTTVTLDYTPVANSGTYVQLYQDGVAKAYTSDFTVSGTTLTVASAPPSNEVSIIRVLFDPTC